MNAPSFVFFKRKLASSRNSPSLSLYFPYRSPNFYSQFQFLGLGFSPHSQIEKQTELLIVIFFCSHQERLEFLYDSGLSVGKTSSEGFKSLEAFPKSDAADAPSSSATASNVSLHDLFLLNFCAFLAKDFFFGLFLLMG